ncbi:ferredoxin [Frankia gtarii]|uniref:ferredoxin n=1 Tax=Frankia gtarii TaxID=2950102 RepID=UPI0027DFE110|nr:ferredoxin [Frankia gtarii]
MRIVLDVDVCEGNALCVGLAPAVFELGDDDLLTVLEAEPDPDHWPDVEAAARACPKQALRIVRDPSQEELVAPPSPPAPWRSDGA